MPPVSQQSASGTNTATNTVLPVAQSTSTINQLSQQVNSTKAGLATPPSNTTSGETDYTDRRNQVTENSGSKKVALVGRYGAGTMNTWGGATQAANAGKTATFSTVIFKVTPQLSESGSISAVDIGEIRSAGSIIVYLGSPARVFNITAKFVSRTVKEASDTWRDINVLKAWRMPMSNTDEPETVRLFAYDKTLKGIPCLMQNINVEWPDDVDYIEASNGAPVPIIQTVTLSLKEVRNFDDINAFDYVSFKQGALDQW